jgi:hypothetical protein
MPKIHVTIEFLPRKCLKCSTAATKLENRIVLFGQPIECIKQQWLANLQAIVVCWFYLLLCKRSFSHFGFNQTVSYININFAI